MELAAWIDARGGIAHRSEARDAGFRLHRLTSPVIPIGRFWLATSAVPVDLAMAATHHARLACVSAAKHLGLALRDEPGERHVWLPPHSKHPCPAGMRCHRSLPIVPPTRHGLVESLPDVLAHVAECLPRVDALVVWESAVHARLVTPAELSRIRWRGERSRRLATLAGDRSDSLLETVLADALREARVPFRQQVRLLGHAVDFLVGERLVVQVDGFAYHASSAQRGRDVEHDARLLLDGHPVLRFDADDVLRETRATVDRIRRALAQGLHLAGRRAGREE